MSYKALKDDTDTFQIGNSEILVLTKNKLIELKKRIQPPRSKDLLDIEELTKLLDE